MKPSGHIGLNTIISLPISYYLVNNLSSRIGLLFLSTSVLVCCLPDIDTKLQHIDIPITEGVSHRGRTHTVQFALLTSIICFFILDYVSDDVYLSITVTLGVFAGILLHLLGDILTPSGINMLPFINRNFCLNAFRYDNLIANTTLPIIGLTGCLLFYSSLDKPITYVWTEILIIEIIAFVSLILSSRYSIQYDGSILKYYD